MRDNFSARTSVALFKHTTVCLMYNVPASRSIPNWEEDLRKISMVEA